MPKRSRRDWPPQSVRHVAPPTVYNVHRPGDKGTSDPFYQFKKAARDDGKPYKSPEPKAEQRMLGLLGTKAAVLVMWAVLAVVLVLVVLVVVEH